MVNYHRNLMPT